MFDTELGITPTIELLLSAIACSEVSIPTVDGIEPVSRLVNRYSVLKLDIIPIDDGTLPENDDEHIKRLTNFPKNPIDFGILPRIVLKQRFTDVKLAIFPISSGKLPPIWL
jgi:hypothetical protein